VLATCRRPEAADALNALAAGHAALSVLPLDVTNPESVAALLETLDSRPIDYLINNAGIYGSRDGQSVGRIDYENWRQVLETNLLAPTRLSEALIENVAASERKVMATISSQMGSTTNNSGGNYLYRSSKAAINNVMRGLAADLAHRHVIVTLLHPGWVKTDMGGAQAPVEPFDSARGIVQLLDEATLTQSGRFFDYRGEELPW
jgi:NAD(P)-dependent dehydrogenase (short-subunit alcohol dehydrogenase family)